jgi:5-hydroxyisourate hydrolase-like protein (transthyretin family)
VSQTADILTENNAGPGEDMDVKLVRLLESQPRPTTVQRTYTEEERRIREAILAQYGEVFLLPHNTLTTVIVAYEL